MRSAAKLALAAGIVMGLSIPAMAVNPSAYNLSTGTGAVFNLYAYDSTGVEYDKGVCIFASDGTYGQIWDSGGGVQMGTWTKDFDLGVTGCTFYAGFLPASANHLDIEGTYCAGPGGFAPRSNYIVANGFDQAKDEYVLILGVWWAGP